jgi:hypothetical protein
MSRPVFLWESLVLGVFGALASVVVAAMALGVLDSAHIHLPLAMHSFLLSDSFGLADLPGSLAGAIALIAMATSIHGLALRGFRGRGRTRDHGKPYTRANRNRAGEGMGFSPASVQLACAGTRPRPDAGVSVCGSVRACNMGAKAPL